MTPNKAMPTWPKERAVERLNRCRVMLALHGFLSESESAKVQARIKKWIAKAKP